MSGPFHQASHFKIDNLEIVQANTVTYAGKSALERLEEHISPGAAHNSDERCDAPKCHPETRAAVQDEILSWITEGGSDAEPKRLLWLTGPAGTGKTAIAGSIAETCSERGLLAGSFFFSSFSGSADRRSKACFVPTLAYQFRKHPSLQGVGKAILSAIENDPAIFRTRLKDQFTELILKPFRQLHGQYDTSTLPKVIIIDGVDECEPLSPPHRPFTKEEAQIAREKEHLEILNALLDAVRDPAFPFRIVVVSRPEHQFTTFFSEVASTTTRKLFLDDKYNPDADIELFLNAKFAEIRRRYHLPASWPTREEMAALVSNASGQFIYAATVIRFVDTRTNPPQEQLDCVLNLEDEHDGSVLTSNPLQALDALYLHIFSTCPHPVATVAWIRGIFEMFTGNMRDPAPFELPAHFWRQLIEWTPGEMDQLLGCIPSLIHLPPPGDRVSSIMIYHKSLLDFLMAETRCAGLYLQFSQMLTEYRRRFLPIIKARGPCIPAGTEPDREEFLAKLLWLPIWCWPRPSYRPSHEQKNIFLTSDARWWIDRYLDDESDNQSERAANVFTIFRMLHSSCPQFYRCSKICKRWRKAIVEGCTARGYVVPGKLRLFLQFVENQSLRMSRPLRYLDLRISRGPTDGGIWAELRSWETKREIRQFSNSILPPDPSLAYWRVFLYRM